MGPISFFEKSKGSFSFSILLNQDYVSLQFPSRFSISFISSKYSCIFPRTISYLIVQQRMETLNPDYPRFRFFRRRNFRSHRFFPSRGRPRVSSSSSFFRGPNPITLALCFLEHREIFVSPRLFIFTTLSSVIRLPQERSSNVARVSFSCPFPPRLGRCSFCQPVLSRITSFRDPGVKNGRVDLAKSVGNMVTMRGKKDPCVCVGSKKRAALELICPSSNDLPRTNLDGFTRV